MINVRSSVFQPLVDSLAALEGLVDGDIGVKLLGHVAQLQEWYRLSLDAANAVVASLLRRQRESVIAVLETKWQLDDVTGDDVTPEAVALMTSTSRRVMTTLAALQYVQIDASGGRLQYSGVIAIVVRRDRAECERAGQQWTEQSGLLIGYGERLAARRPVTVGPDTLTLLQRFWSLEVGVLDTLAGCVVAFPQLLGRIEVAEQRRRASRYANLTDASSPAAGLMQGVFRRLRLSPLLSATLAAQYARNTVDVARLVTMFNNASEVSFIRESLRSIQLDIQREVVAPFELRLREAQRGLVDQYAAAFSLFTELSLYTGPSVLARLPRLSIWRRPTPCGPTKVTRFAVAEPEHWPSYPLDELLRVAPRKAADILNEYIVTLAKDVKVMYSDLLASTDEVLDLVERYRTHLEKTVSALAVNEAFVRQVAAARICRTPIVTVPRRPSTVSVWLCPQVTTDSMAVCLCPQVATDSMTVCLCPIVTTDGISVSLIPSDH